MTCSSEFVTSAPGAFDGSWVLDQFEIDSGRGVPAGSGMRWKSAFLLAVGLLAGGMAAAEPLRVLCFNLRYIAPEDKGDRAWTVRRDPAAELIRGDSADIVGIQEGLPTMMNDLADRLDGYVALGVGREDGVDRGEYAAILVSVSRFRVQECGTFWLSDTPEVPASRSWGNQVTRICTWAKLYDRKTKRVLHVFNAHFDHESSDARRKGAELILSRIRDRVPAGPVLLMGDFNAPESDPLHAAVLGAGFTDVWRSLHPDVPVGESGTFHRFTGRVDGPRIDFIYASPFLKATEASVLREPNGTVWPSDHFPVRATVEFVSPVVNPGLPSS